MAAKECMEKVLSNVCGKMNRKRTILLLFFIILQIFACKQSDGGGISATGEKNRHKDLQIISDMRGKEILTPQTIDRVVTLSDGFIEGIMYYLGEVDKIAGLGSRCLQSTFNYEYANNDGEIYRYENGMNPVSFLVPKLKDLPLIAASNVALNYETLASLRPDVVILRAGSCTFGSLDDENTQKTIRTIEAMGLPLLVLKGPPCYDQPTLNFITEEIQVIGRLFGKEKKAQQLAEYLEEEARKISERTQDLSEEEKKRVLLLGLSPRVRASGGAGNTKGKDTIESFFIEEFAHAKNAYEGMGGRASYVVLSAEQIYALDPDIILLPTSSGYHPATELYSAPYFKNLHALRAVKEQKVYALPWTPCNCAKRMEYPAEMMIMAKAAYPDRFADIKVHEWVLTFYQKIYGVEPAIAQQIRSIQWLDWMVEQNF